MSRNDHKARESGAKPLNRLALASIVAGLTSPVIFLTFVAVGMLQETGHDIWLQSHRYESAGRVLMLVLSISAVILSYRADFAIAISNGLYRGARLAAAGRLIGYIWGSILLFFMIRWFI